MNDSSESDGQVPGNGGGASKKDYEVGYGKPPKHTQFPKGNPGGGRRKGSRSFKTDLLAELAEKVVITEDGKKVRRTKQQILIKAQVQKGMKGHVGAGAYVTGLILKLIGPDGDAQAPDALPTSDLEIIEAYVQRLLAERAKS